MIEQSIVLGHRWRINLIEWDGIPLLSLFTMGDDQLALVLLVDSDGDAIGGDWHNPVLVFIQLDSKMLDKYLNKVVTLLHVMQKSSDLVAFHADGDSTYIDGHYTVDNLPPSWLPDEDWYLCDEIISGAGEYLRKNPLMKMSLYGAIPSVPSLVCAFRKSEKRTQYRPL